MAHVGSVAVSGILQAVYLKPSIIRIVDRAAKRGP